MSESTVCNPGCLYVVATPIGNLEDMTPRALRVLKEVDVIAAEDTRHSGRLLAHFGLRTSMMSLHDHNEAQRIEALANRIEAGESVALISDAGTPLISDPGFALVREFHRRGLTVSPVPGASALTAAISVAGLPTDRFVFEGFLPAKAGARDVRLGALADEERTMLFYVSVHQASKQLQHMIVTFGAARAAMLGRELTKLHETLWSATLGELAERWEAHRESHKGELVLVVAGAAPAATDDSALDDLLALLLSEVGARQAAKLAVKLSGCSRNEAYQRALAISKADEQSRR